MIDTRLVLAAMLAATVALPAAAKCPPGYSSRPETIKVNGKSVVRNGCYNYKTLKWSGGGCGVAGGCGNRDFDERSKLIQPVTTMEHTTPGVHQN